MNVFAIYAITPRLQTDFMPAAVFSNQEDAEAAKGDIAGICVTVLERPMETVMDDLLAARLTLLGLKLDIVPAEPE